MKLKFNFNRGIRLEDVTVELEKEAYEEMRHNI